MNNVHVRIVMCDCNCAGLFYQNNIIQYKFKRKMFVGLSLGANVVAARCFGAKDEHGIQDTVHTAVTLGLTSGVLLAVVGFFAARSLLELMSCPEDVIDLSSLYLKIHHMDFLGLHVLKQHINISCLRNKRCRADQIIDLRQLLLHIRLIQHLVQNILNMYDTDNIINIIQIYRITGISHIPDFCQHFLQRAGAVQCHDLLAMSHNILRLFLIQGKNIIDHLRFTFLQHSGYFCV